MKTQNYNENVKRDNVVININYYDGQGEIFVTANHSLAERTTTVNLSYDSKTGERNTEVSNFTPPFDSQFYEDVDAKVKKVVNAISMEE